MAMNSRMSVLSLTLLVSGLIGLLGVSCQESIQPPQSPGDTVVDDGPGQARKPVAVVFGKSVYRTPSKDLREDIRARWGETRYQAWLDSYGDREIAHTICMYAAEVYCTEHKLSVSSQQLDDAYNHVVSRMPPGESPGSEEEKQLRKDVEMRLRQWELDKAIHKKYGGQFLAHLRGLSPCDATEKWLRELEAKGSLQILDHKVKECLYPSYETGSPTSFRFELEQEQLRLFYEKPTFLWTKEDMESLLEAVQKAVQEAVQNEAAQDKEP